MTFRCRDIGPDQGFGAGERGSANFSSDPSNRGISKTKIVLGEVESLCDGRIEKAWELFGGL